MESDSLGHKLKRAREARGMSLHEVAAASKISMVSLEALEQGDFSRLPGGLYSRAFVRAYAGLVGFDPEEAVREFVGELATHEREAARVRIRPAVTADDRAFLERQQRALRLLRAGAIVGAVLLVALLAWLASQWWPGEAVDPEGPPAASAATRQPATPPPPADPVPLRAGAPMQAGRERLIVAFEVTDACWVQATADGLVVLSRLLQAGDRETLSADREIVLDVGNAGAFVWTINGQSAQMLGREGRRRQVTLTRENAGTFLR